MKYECSKCKKYGLKYERKYKPSGYLEGKRNSPIWIVGLNPKGELGENDKREVGELENCFDKKEDIYNYFKSFKKVSDKLYNLLGKDKGAAHTDIVKCYSKKFPPKDCKGKDVEIIVNNCKEHFSKQLKELCPKMIICNGVPVCDLIKEIIKPSPDEQITTRYIGNFNGKEIVVILSGFIGQIDNYAKRRLGKEIESSMREYEIGGGYDIDEIPKSREDRRGS